MSHQSGNIRSFSIRSIRVLIVLAPIFICFALVAIEQLQEQKGPQEPADKAATHWNNSLERVSKGVFEGPVAVNVEEKSEPRTQATHKLIANGEPVETPSVNALDITLTSTNRRAVWPSGEKYTRKHLTFGDFDMTKPLKTISTAGIAEPQRNLEDREEEARGDQPHEAVRFRNMQLQDENGEIPIDGLQKAREQMNVMLDAQQKKAVASGKPDELDVAGIDPGTWAWLGPGNIGGRIRSIVIDPINPNRMWVGSVSGGIWYSTNAGSSWSPVNDFMANLAVSTMVIDPTNSNIIYAGTGESFAADLTATEGERLTPDGFRGFGIFKSVDGGVKWTQLAQTDPSNPSLCSIPVTSVSCSWIYINRLAISPNGSTILAATTNGIQRSTDGGNTWSSAPSFGGNIQDIDFDPTDSSKAIAATDKPAATRYSTDGGQTWLVAPTATFSPAISANANGFNRIELAYAPSNPNIVYAAVNSNNGDIYKSINGGQTYTRSNTGTNFFLGAGNQGDYDNIIWVNPMDPTFIIVGGIDLWRSIDSGTNFTQISRWQNAPATSAHADQHMIVASPAFNNTTNKTLYFSNDGGIYRADNASTVSQTSGWVNLNNSLGITQFYGAAANSAGVIVGGAQDNGNSRYNGNLNSWTLIPGMGGDGGYVAADATDSSFFYGEYVYLQIRRSNDGGANGGDISSGITDATCTPLPGGNCTPPANFIAPFILDPNEPNRILAGGLSLWRSNDAKNTTANPTWSSIKPPVSNGLIPPSNIPISAITVSPVNPDFVVVGHNFGDIYLALDGTGTNPPTTAQCAPGNSPCWSKIDTATVPNRFVTSLVVDETRSPNWIYATFGGFSNNNVYVTKDFGSTWIDVSGVTGSTTDLPSVPIRSLAINPVRPDFIYVGTEVGVFASEDAGATWELPQDGPANVSVDQLIWLSGDLVAVTHGRGLYKTATPIVSSPMCVPPNPGLCPCFGDWNCPCTWNAGHVPTANDDIAIVCPVHLASGGGQARNMNVQGILTIDSGLAVTEDIVNAGSIRSSPGVVSSFSCRNLSNSRGGVISLLGGISASGNVANAGIIALGMNLNSNDLTTTARSTLTAETLYVSGNLENSGYTDVAGSLGQGTINVAGNVYNGGTLKAQFCALTSPARVKNFSGTGLWQFGNLGIPFGHTVVLGSDLTFDIATFGNGGTLDFSDKSINFNGSSFNSSGATLGTGILRFLPSSGNAVFNGNGPDVRIASGTVEYQSGGTISQSLVIAPGATFSMNTSGTLTVNKDVLVNGTLNKPAFGSNPSFIFNGQTFTNNGVVGDIDFLTFNDGGGLPVQFIGGTGSWSPKNVQIGAAGSPSTLNLNNNIALSSNQLLTAAGSALNVGNFTVTITGPMNFFAGKISGTGLVKMQPSGGNQPRMGTPFGALTIDPPVEIASGTVRATTLITNGKLSIDPGATLSPLGSVGVVANGDVENNGTLNAFSDGPSFKFKGATFTNNGVVTGNVYVNFGDFFGPPFVQNLGGTGSWAGSPRLLIDSTSTTTLLNDFTYNGGNLFVEGRVNTGAFTLSLPCSVPWGGSGDVIGNIRRTNLASCPGATFAFGNPFTTIQFTSGTPPTDITVNVGLTSPAGFPNAASRTYIITPTGGSGYTATLRLHYLDSELNGNAESSLQLWRNNGTNWTPQGATNRNITQNWVEYNNVTQFSPWAIAQFAPTAAGVSVSGRVLTSDGRGVRNAFVTLTDQQGVARRTITSSFGYYRFDDVATGETYVAVVTSKRHEFAPQVISVSDDLTDVDFVASP